MTGPTISRTVFGVLAGLWIATFTYGAYALSTRAHDRVVVTMLILALPYAAMAWWVLRRATDLEGPRVRFVIVGVAIVARAVLLPMPPYSSDIYRYVWDGRVQAAGINPYRYMPADPALERLRDTAIYPNINRAATAVTIYPPAAEAFFLAVNRVADSLTAMKIALVLCELVGAFALMRLLAARGLPQTRILLYAWHPLPLFEFAGAGHIDAAAIACMLVALLWAQHRRPGLAGVALALGAGVKYFPAFIAPSLWRRWDRRLPAAFLAVLAALYLPYVLGIGGGVLGFLPGYIQEEKFDAANGVVWLAYLDWLAPLPKWLPSAYLVAACGGLLIGGVAVMLRRQPERIAPTGAFILLAAFTVIVTPHYPWYFCWTVPFLCLRPSPAIGWLTAASPFLYGVIWPYDPLLKQAFMYVPFVIILALELTLLRGTGSTQEIPVDRHLGPQPTA